MSFYYHIWHNDHKAILFRSHIVFGSFMLIKLAGFGS